MTSPRLRSATSARTSPASGTNQTSPTNGLVLSMRAFPSPGLADVYTTLTEVPTSGQRLGRRERLRLVRRGTGLEGRDRRARRPAVRVHADRMVDDRPDGAGLVGLRTVVARHRHGEDEAEEQDDEPDHELPERSDPDRAMLLGVLIAPQLAGARRRWSRGQSRRGSGGAGLGRAEAPEGCVLGARGAAGRSCDAKISDASSGDTGRVRSVRCVGTSTGSVVGRVSVVQDEPFHQRCTVSSSGLTNQPAGRAALTRAPFA